MTLAALIAAYHEGEEGGLRATLPLAGRTLLERQARLAAAAGANPVIILVERMSPTLVAAIDRLRHEGIRVEAARRFADAADMVSPDDRVLLVADGLVADQKHLARLLTADERAVLVLPDQNVDDRFERIDARSRWAGLALIDGALLKDTAAMLGDWDPQSTLLRRAVQQDARLLFTKSDAGTPLAAALRASDLVETEECILEAAGGSGEEWASRYLLAPIEAAAARALMPASIAAEWLRILAAVLTALGALLFVKHWLWAGVLALLLATPLDGIADRLARLRLQRQGASWWTALLPILAAVALVALGYALSPARGWGCIALALTAIAFILALRGETAGAEIEGRGLLAERKGMTWLMLPFAVTGLWLTGLSVLAVYAAGSFFWAQRQAHRPAPPAAQD